MDDKDTIRARVGRTLQKSLAIKQSEGTRVIDESNKNDDPNRNNNSPKDIRLPSQAGHRLSIAEARQDEPRDCGPKLLCTMCQYIFEHWDEVPTAALHHKTFRFYDNTSTMRSAANDGCLLCGQFLYILESSGVRKDLSIDKGVAVQQVDLNQAVSWRLKLYCDFRGSSSAFVPMIRVSLKSNDTSVEGGVKFSLGTVHENNGKHALPLVKRWLHECLSPSLLHDTCHLPKEAFIPTRLIYLGDVAPRLILCSEVKDYPDYATLSHCWGSAAHLTLSRSNLEEFTRQIPAEALPRTFVDAIEVVRSLHIDYLWIDSLCIIQEKDSRDWALESSRMAQVYGNSMINIGATAAVDSSEGIFNDVNEHRNSSFITLAQIKDVKVPYQCTPTSLYACSILRSPLAQRGWVLQERLLAPRTIHFTRTQLFWECNNVVACEAFPATCKQFLEEGLLEKKSLLQYSWDEIINNYSRCKLTFGTDKLVAISGIARAVNKYKCREYLAGLWEGDERWGHDGLIVQLCWQRHFNGVCRRPVEFRGPSWSWVSIDSAVRMHPEIDFEKGSHSVHVQLLRKDIELTSQDSYGAVSHASLFISCDVIYGVSWHTLRDHYAQTKFEGVEVQIFFHLDCSDEQPKQVYLVPVVSDLKTPTIDRHTHFRRICSQGSLRGLEGLLLTPTGSNKGEYRRIGSFDTIPPRPNIRESELDHSPLPSFAYQELTSDELGGISRYKITLL